ncbi:MarR family winged helix-turn-helix transcriptional regulator [Undibacterium sp.]|jgi:DNA-binding MarR family transcriptional regulator|uniref:MarR family winged helix-turn-helix transcriptional regulator n=1 Tax=Undibacterium sp. TaxID=1914977 RepID=UPI002BDC941B|nr:MarR family transcriptional regulator [Undibacterium sp.]HTD03815.1 MarR family transcriptional regulator [Undibacterium sp.]
MVKKKSLTEPGALKQDADEIPSRLEILKKLRVVIRAAQRHSLWIEKQCGVSGAQLWIMQELHENSGLRVGELARKLAIHQTTTSNLLDALEKRGYVVKARDAQDQRVVKVKLTKEGTQTLLSAPTPARGLLPEALMQMDEASLARLDQGLQGLLDSIDVLDEGFGMLPLPFTM